MVAITKVPLPYDSWVCSGKKSGCRSGINFSLLLWTITGSNNETVPCFPVKMSFVLLTRQSCVCLGLTAIVSLLSHKLNKTSRALEFRQYLNYEGTVPEEIMFIFADLDNKMVGSLKTIAKSLLYWGVPFLWQKRIPNMGRKQVPYSSLPYSLLTIIAVLQIPRVTLVRTDSTVLRKCVGPGRVMLFWLAIQPVKEIIASSHGWRISQKCWVIARGHALIWDNYLAKRKVPEE